MNPLSSLFSFIVPGPGADESHEACVGDVEPATDVDVGIVKVGAWTGTSSIASLEASKKAVSAAVAIGLGRIDVIVNDHSAARQPVKFDTFNRDRIACLAELANTAGINVHLMSWAQPTVDYIEEAGDILIPLAERCCAKSIQFDLEEPWTQCTRPMRGGYAAAGELVGKTFADVTLGCNAIGYASVEKVGPALAVADYIVPQCYSTESSGLDPATVVPRLVARWRKVFAHKPIVVGLAAYRQNVKGYTQESAIRAAFGGAEALPDVHEVVYWSLAYIRKNAAVWRAVSSLAKRSKG